MEELYSRENSCFSSLLVMGNNGNGAPARCKHHAHIIVRQAQHGRRQTNRTSYIDRARVAAVQITHARTRTRAHKHMRALNHTRAHTQTHTHTHPHAHTHSHTRTHTCMMYRCSADSACTVFSSTLMCAFMAATSSGDARGTVPNVSCVGSKSLALLHVGYNTTP